MIYFISQQNKYVKIGYTNQSIKARLQILQVGNPFKLKVYDVIDGDRKLERKIHKHFIAYHLRGEWYHFSNDIKWYLARIRTDEANAKRTELSKVIRGMTPKQVSEYVRDTT